MSCSRFAKISKHIGIAFESRMKKTDVSDLRAVGSCDDPSFADEGTAAELEITVAVFVKERHLVGSAVGFGLLPTDNTFAESRR